VEDKHIRCLCQKREPESFPNTWLWTTGNEELDFWDISQELSKDREDRRSGFFVFAFVQRVDYDYGRNAGFDEGLDYERFHLPIQRFLSDFWLRLDERNKGRSKCWIPPCELDGEGREDESEVASVLEVPGAKERCTKPTVCECPLGDRPCDGAFPRPGESIQPINRGLPEVACPKLDFI
jgi:hypothetical protein